MGCITYCSFSCLGYQNFSFYLAYHPKHLKNKEGWTVTDHPLRHNLAIALLHSNWSNYIKWLMSFSFENGVSEFNIQQACSMTMSILTKTSKWALNTSPNWMRSWSCVRVKSLNSTILNYSSIKTFRRKLWLFLRKEKRERPRERSSK